MIPIQEVDIYSNNGIKISAHVVVPNTTTASSEAVIYDPNYNSLYSSYQTIGSFTNPDEAYKSIASFAQKYITQSGGSISRINNPCNTEFVNKDTQQQIINDLAINITIEVNA